MEPGLTFQNRNDIETALSAVGELLAGEGQTAAIVVLGGAALNLLGLVDRSTTDVDIIAILPITERGELSSVLHHPDPLPDALKRAIATVARDYRLEPDWMNTGPALQWRFGLPPGLETRILWKTYGALRVGLLDRADLIAFKLFAAADNNSRGAHFQDLIALRPSLAELADAKRWVIEQDASPIFPTLIDQAIEELKPHVGL